jgi:hypothetical protein
MAPSSRPDPESNRIQDFVAWIDRALEEDLPVREIASVLTANALPNHRGLVSPFVYGSEGWYWPWNRVGFAYIQRERYLDAASIFSGAYLSALRIQHDYQERIHKGMPLCNVAYSFLRARESVKARVPAALGMIEDIITFAGPPSSGNISNLRASEYPELLVQSIIDYADEMYRSRGRFPMYPEVVLYTRRWETFLNTPKTAHTIQQIVAAMQQLASQFAPDTFESSLKHLGLVWLQYGLIVPPIYTQGDPAHGRAEPTLEVGPDPIAGTAPIAGSNAAR